MTITLEGNPTSYVGTGADTPLATVFLYFVDSDVVVTQRVISTGAETLMVKGTHYNISGGSSVGAAGTVTPIAGITDFADTVRWTLERSIPLTQEHDYVDNDDFPAQSHETGMDRLTMQSQDDNAKSVRSLRIPFTDLPAVTTILPSSVDRASKALTFDSNGNATVSTQTTTGHAKVVLDSVTELATATATLNAVDWPATYDRVELEISGLSAGSNGAIQFEPIISGASTSSNLISVGWQVIVGTPPAGSASASSTADWTPVTSNAAGFESAVRGCIVFTHYGGFIVGQGALTFKDTSGGQRMIDLGLWYTADETGNYDGFEVTHSGGNFACDIRLWGIPKV